MVVRSRLSDKQPASHAQNGQFRPILFGSIFLVSCWITWSDPVSARRFSRYFRVTLIEVLVWVAIVAIVFTLLMPVGSRGIVGF